MERSNNANTALMRPVNIDDARFLEKLNLLDTLTSSFSTDTSLTTVATTGGFLGLFNHHVTGEELNNLIEEIEKHIINQNKGLLNHHQEFRDVYELFATLNGEYLTKIMCNFEIAFKALEEARETSERLDEQQTDIRAAQQDIEQLIRNQKITIQALSNNINKINSKIDGVEHSALEQKNNLKKVLADLSKLKQSLEQQKSNIQAIQSFKEKLEKQKSMFSIDKIASDARDSRAKIENLESTITAQRDDNKRTSDQLLVLSASLDSFQTELDALRDNTQRLLKRQFIINWIAIASAFISIGTLILFLAGVII